MEAQLNEIKLRARALEEWFRAHDETHPNWKDNRETYQEFSNLLLNANTNNHDEHD
jgi:hypothetical protein